MKPFIYVPPATNFSGWCAESKCDACTWVDCTHHCHATEDGAA